MILVFDNGDEQEIREKDFHEIINRALECSNRNYRTFLEAAVSHAKQDDYKLALLCMKWADEESSIATICTTLETLCKEIGYCMADVQILNELISEKYDSQYSDK